MTTVLGCLTPFGPRHGAVLRRLQRVRPARPAQPARGGRLGGRARHPRPLGHDRRDRGRPRHRPGARRRWPTVVVAAAERLAAAAGLRLVTVASDAAAAARARGPWPTSRPWSSTSATRTPTASTSSRARSPAGIEARAGALRPRTGGVHRALPAPAQRCHGRPLRPGGLRLLLHPPRRGLRGRGSATLDAPGARPHPRDRLHPGHHEQRGAHGAVEPQRQPGREHPRRSGRRPAGRAAGPGRPPPRGAAARPRAAGRARHALAPRGARARRTRSARAPRTAPSRQGAMSSPG